MRKRKEIVRCVFSIPCVGFGILIVGGFSNYFNYVDLLQFPQNYTKIPRINIDKTTFHYKK